MTSKLEQIRNDLNKYIDDQLANDPASRDWEVFAFEDKLCEVIEQIEEFNEDSLKWDSIPDDDKKECEDAFYAIEPTDQEIMSSFGTKWHDAL